MIRDASAECPEPFAANAPAAGLNGGFVVAGLDRRFFLRLPITDSVEPSPLMVFFHGTNGSGDIVDRFPFAATLAERGFIVVGPYGEDLGTVWPEWDAMRADGDRERPNSDLHFFDTLVACLAGHFAIDQNRLYVSGMSAGGIMSNRVLRERSSLLAGGIVGSGIFDMTEPAAPADLDAMAVMVAFGGDNDEWGGDHAGKTLPSINFAEQASLASKFYEGQPNVTQYACRGNDVGHRWLQPANELMADFLLAHPKGLADNASYALPALPTDADVVCTADAVQHDPTLEVVCPLKTDPRCRAACQMLADCVVENTTVRPIMEPQLSDYGFYGEHREDCSDCVSQCESDAAAGGAADDQVLDCIVAAAPQCAQGIQGALPLTKTVNGCCDGRHDSAVCRRICAPVLQNNTVSGFFTGCAGF
jgi:predicted esterase